MIHGFYFRFYKYTHCSWLSILLAHMAYACFFCRYLLQRLRCREKRIERTAEAALAELRQFHPDPGRTPAAGMAQPDPAVELSIIVPVYNYASLIEANIQSILNQKTGYRFQLILVDDGSTDGAREILKRYEGREDVLVLYQENQGIAGARNTGLCHAVGKYIMFVDCDDTVEPDLVETLMTLAQRENSDIAMCAHSLEKERDGTVYASIPNVYPQKDLLGYARSAQILNYPGLPWCKVYRRELWEQVRFLPGYWYEDTIIHMLLFTQCSKFSYTDRVCYRYRWYEGNFSHTQEKSRSPKCADTYWMLLPILEKYTQLGLPRDARFETVLLKHLSAYYYPKIAMLPEQIVEGLFALACGLYAQYGVPEAKVPYMLRVTRKALKQRNMELWKLAIRYQK